MKDQQLIEEVATLCLGWTRDTVSVVDDVELDAPVDAWRDPLTQDGEVNWYTDYKNYNPIANTPEGRSQAIELAEKYKMWINFMEFVVLAPRRDGSYVRVPCNYDSWQRAVCEAAVRIEKEKANEQK